jgi:hypothetical protein
MKRKRKLEEKKIAKERLATVATFPIAEAVVTVELAGSLSSLLLRRAGQAATVQRGSSKNER